MDSMSSCSTKQMTVKNYFLFKTKFVSFLRKKRKNKKVLFTEKFRISSLQKRDKKEKFMLKFSKSAFERKDWEEIKGK